MDQLQRLIIKGRSAVPNYIPLTPLDIYLGHYVIGGAYFFLRPPDISRLKAALAITLDRHPTFGACMVREARGIGLNCGEAGAELLIHRSSLDGPNLRSTESLITAALLTRSAAGSQLSLSDYQSLSSENEPLLSDNEHLFSGNQPLLSDDQASSPSNQMPMLDDQVPSYSFNSGQPVASFQLTIFNNGHCALLIRHVHSQADGAGAIHFLRNWSRAYRGLPLSRPSSYSRAHVADLATMPGLAPSSKLNIRMRNSLQRSANEPDNEYDSPQCHDPIGPGPRDSMGPVRDSGSIRVDIPSAALDNFVHDCRRSSRLSLTSSEVLHALVWQSFIEAHFEPLCTCTTGAQRTSSPPTAAGDGEPAHAATENLYRLYTLFDLRNIESLGIPSDYDGSAVLGRCAKLSAAQLKSLSTPELALAIQRQLKPFTAEEAHTDISYLAREYEQGYIDESGNYANFVIGAWLECRSPGGLIVNDLRRLAVADLCFEEPPARMETLVSGEINMVSIYQNDDGTVTLHYVGERRTLSGFAEHLHAAMAL